ncbi:MAG: GNAT family N-acetyltransferase, partial [Actinomycetota bacterium]|nr:GNAT family N-acetyltransferase [Actinomycetota bacterium]
MGGGALSQGAARIAGVDTGGTFTDAVGEDGSISKVVSDRNDPAAAVGRAVEALGGAATLFHGTTVATNAVLERRGGCVALVTSEGFADVIEIGRQDRPSLYDAFSDRPVPLVPRRLRFEVAGRLDALGREIEPLGSVPDLPPEVESVAVCLLHADRSAEHERAVASELRARGFDVTCSSELSPEFREFERTVTTVLNAYLRPPCRSYLGGLAAVADEVAVLTSAGGLIPLAEAVDRPAALLLSGPAGGVTAGAAAAVAAGFGDAVTFDMGGTSTDVCLVLDGRPAPAAQRAVAGFPVRLPSLDVHTIGAGGGSIAGLDAGGALVVGPESAGARPGPACYGLGGRLPTVTDADLVAGRMGADAGLPGIGPLDVVEARAALAAGGVTADGVLAVVDEAMVQAVRAVTVARGVDPRSLALVAFGGAGPLHACAIAEALDMKAVVVPPRAGVLSAVGIVGANRQCDLVRSWRGDAEAKDVEDALVDLAVLASRAVGGGADVDVALDCRYAGQSHELTVPDVADFTCEHERRNGYAVADGAIEVVALRATARLSARVDMASIPVTTSEPRRDAVGPVVLAEPDCTVWVPNGWQAEVHHHGSWILTRVASPPNGSAVVASVALDPAALQVLIARLTGVAEEMGAVLRRAAFSPNIKERADCSAALFTAAGELLVQAEHIPVHLGSMPASVLAAIGAIGADRLRPGDQVLLNDPFAGGTHLNDLTMVAPCFVDGVLVGWAANRAHHADVGGMAPGSIPPEATEIHQEGLRIPPVVLTPSIVELLCANSRTPEERRGDLAAQVGANRVGVERLAAFAAAPLAEVLDYGERRMRAALAAVPDGRYCFEDVLDTAGPSPDQRNPVRVAVEVVMEDQSVTFDFSGSDPQTSGNVNAVAAVTASCVAFALRSAADPTMPANGGSMRPVRVIAPVGSVVAAEFPAAVGAGNVEVSQRVADVCLGALALALPGAVGAASQGTMNNLIIGGGGWVYYETIAGGQGGRPGGLAGMSGVHTGMTNTLNTPTEALERAFPMRVLRYRLRTGSGGAGAAPGGDGIERDLLMLEDVTVSLITERRVSAPWGLAGGGPGAVGENWLLPGGNDARAERLLDKCTVRLAAGDVLRMLTPGGGGWGEPETVAVRAMTTDDIEVVQEVEVAAGELFRSIPDPRISKCADHPPMPADTLRFFMDQDLAWVATVGDAVVGFLVAEVLEDALHVEEVAVDPDYGRRGIATALLDVVADRAAARGLSGLTLTTFRDVQWNRPFYERRRFEVLAEPVLTNTLRARFVEEEERYGLLRELRVVMR